jgi:hypothetical protein
MYWARMRTPGCPPGTVNVPGPCGGVSVISLKARRRGERAR